MSRKNNLQRRKAQDDYDKQREIDIKKKQEEKRLRKQQNKAAVRALHAAE
jgi:hypothetical protein